MLVSSSSRSCASLLDDALLDVLAHSAEVDGDVLGALVEQQRYQLVASEK